MDDFSVNGQPYLQAWVKLGTRVSSKASKGGLVARTWSEDEAAGWLNADTQGEILDLPRRIAASIVSRGGEISRILDIASGPGAFLKVFLEMFPRSVGIWHDASETMRASAESVLATYGSRISWVTGDMYNISSLNLPRDLDVVLTSRATHHLTSKELHGFYSDIANLVRPGGWIVNLDHIYLGPRWDQLFRSARKELLPRKRSEGEEPAHKHSRSAPELSDHIAALGAVGISDIETAWQAYYTFLILARKP